MAIHTSTRSSSSMAPSRPWTAIRASPVGKSQRGSFAASRRTTGRPGLSTWHRTLLISRGWLLPEIDIARSEGGTEPGGLRIRPPDKPPYVRSRAYSFAAGKAFARPAPHADVGGRCGRASVRDTSPRGKTGEQSRSSSPTTATRGQSTALAGTATQAGEARAVHAIDPGSVHLRWPGHVAAGTRTAASRARSTSLRLRSGCRRHRTDPAKPPLDGHLCSRLRGGRASCSSTRRESWIPTWASLRTNKYQYIEYYGEGGGADLREYYNS